MNQTSYSCNICGRTINIRENTIYCPDCGEIYHDHCWKKNHRKCNLRGCEGRTYFCGLSIEIAILKKLGVVNNHLSVKCPKCSNTSSPLNRFCTKCGYEVNKPSSQRAIIAFPILKWIQHNNISMLFVLLVIFLFFVTGSGLCIFEIVNVLPGFNSGSTPDKPISLVSPTVEITLTLNINPSNTPIQSTTNLFIPSPKTTNPPTRTLPPSPTKTRTPRIAPTLIRTSTPDFYTGDTCPGTQSKRVTINDLVRVITSNQDRLILRSIPKFSRETEIMRLDKGVLLKIHDGPVCVRDSSTGKNYWFWEVRVKSNNRRGWIAEGDSRDYYIEPVR